MGTGCTVSCHVRQQTLGGPERGRAAADPARPGHSSARIRVETCGPGVGSAVGRGLEKSGRLSLCAVHRPSLTLKEALAGANWIRDLTSTAFPLRRLEKCFSPCLENPSGSSDSGCYRCPQLPGQGEGWALLLGPHLRSCLFPAQGQVGEICSLIFSSADSATGNSRTALQRIHTPIPSYTCPSSQSSLTRRPLDAGARRSRSRRRAVLETQERASRSLHSL